MKSQSSFLKVCSALVLVSILSACGGRTPNPVMVAQYGDYDKSCRALQFEMNTIQGEIQRLLPKSDKTGKNVALGVAGWFLLVPWFFMDFKNAEQTEYEAYRQRYNHLATIALDKKCKVKPVDLPSVEEMRQEYESQNNQDKDKNGLNK